MTDPVKFSARDNDIAFYTTVLKAVALCGVSVGVPFAIYHLIWGNPVISLMLLPVVVLQLVSLYLLQRRGFNHSLALLLAVTQMGVTTVIALQVGVLGSYWLFASGVANYYIVERRSALAINATACLIVGGFAFESVDIVIRLVAAFAMINVFLFAFARQLEFKNTELDQMLTIDPLTRAGNRTALEESLRRVKNQFDRYQTPATLMMLDLDHFKQINDSQGHAEGDKVLRKLASQIQERLRASDTLYRFGGEEFIIIAENTRISQAAYLAEDIRRRTALANDVTISIGLAELRADETTDSLVTRADRALYKAKSMGRNWVCFDADQDGKSDGAESTLNATVPAGG